jgi:hypothetical protein
VQPGDEVLVLFLERDVSAWIATGQVSDPETRRRHHFSDALALPVLFSDPNRIPSYQTGAIEIRTDDRSGRFTLYANGTVEIRTASTVEIGDGSEDVVSLLSDLCQEVSDLLIDHSGARPVAPSSQAALAALKARIDSLKP